MTNIYINPRTTLGEIFQQDSAPVIREGESSQIQEEDFVRLVGTVRCHVTQAVNLSDVRPYLKLIACLIYTETLYPSSISYKVIQAMSSGLFRMLENPSHQTPAGVGKSSSLEVKYRFYTRTPCIPPSDIPKIGGSGCRSFNIMGSSHGTGFMEYRFSAKYYHLKIGEVSTIEDDYYTNVEEYLTDMKCKDVMDKIKAIRKQFNTFELSPYLGLLQYCHSGYQLGTKKTFPDGWLTSSLREDKKESKTGPTMSFFNRLFGCLLSSSDSGKRKHRSRNRVR
ncbi:MAG: ORF3 [XiangYun mono-chu-like virus 11]|nr:MAG: ORF3 [XiangYun mono-chu-like virus 11]